MRSWLRDRLACAEGRANAWLYLYGQGNRVESLGRLRVPNAVLLPCIFIDPMRIEYKCNIRGEAQAQHTLFRDGDWDVRRKSLPKSIPPIHAISVVASCWGVCRWSRPWNFSVCRSVCCSAVKPEV